MYPKKANRTNDRSVQRRSTTDCEWRLIPESGRIEQVKESESPNESFPLPIKL